MLASFLTFNYFPDGIVCIASFLVSQFKFSKEHNHQSHLDSCREPAWGIPPVTRSCGRDLMGKASQISGFPPGISWACTQKNILPAFVLCFSTLLTHSGKSQLRALVFCIWQGVSIQKPLWWLSSLPAGLIQLHVWLFEACWPQEAKEA